MTDDLRDAMRDLFEQVAAAAADPRPMTPGCPHGRRWCEGCEDARAHAASKAETDRLFREAGLP